MPLSRNPQPSPLLESLSSSFDSVTSLSVFPSALSVSSSSLFVLSSSLSSSHSSLCSTPASIVFLHDRVPLPPSISLFSFPSSLFLSPDSLTVCDLSLVSGSVPVSPPCANDSDVFLSCSHSAEICPNSGVAHGDRFDVVQPSPVDRPPEDPPPDVADELRAWFQAYVGLGIAEPALPTASGLLPTTSNSGDFSGFLVPTNEFEEDALPFSNIVENSSFCSYGSCNAFLAPRNNDERGLQSLGSPGSVVPSSSFDDSHPTLVYGENLLSPPTGFEVDALSFCFRESRNEVHGFRSDPELPSRVSTLGPTLGSSSPRPLHEVSILDGELGYTMRVSTGILCPTDSKPADEYDPPSEPEPPDPSCASR